MKALLEQISSLGGYKMLTYFQLRLFETLVKTDYRIQLCVSGPCLVLQDSNWERRLEDLMSQSFVCIYYRNKKYNLEPTIPCKDTICWFNIIYM